MSFPTLLLPRRGHLGNRYTEPVQVNPNSQLVFDSQGNALTTAPATSGGPGPYVFDEDTDYFDPNLNIKALAPAIAYSKQGSVWFKTNSANNVYGWEQRIASPGSLTALPTPSAYLKMLEDSNSATRADATGNGYDFNSIGNTNPALATPIVGSANLFATTDLLRSPSFELDTLAEHWAFWTWLYLGVPAASGTIFKAASGTKNQVKLEYIWNSVAGTLTFRLQSGYYAPPLDATPYYNIITLSGLSSPLNTWYFLAASLRGVNLGSGYAPELNTLRVNSTISTLPTLDLDAVNPPDHDLVDDNWYIGPLVGRLGPIALYLQRSLNLNNLDSLYNSGAGLALY